MFLARRREAFPKTTILLIGLLSTLVGCSGSGDVIDGGATTPSSEDLTRVMQSLVLPAVEGMGAFTPVNMPGAEAAGVECSPFDELCLSGSFEICNGDPAGGLRFLYEACDRPVGIVDGSWQLNLDGFTSATAEFDLSVDEVELSGGVGYALSGLCWEKTFVDFSATGTEGSVMIDGAVDYCLGSGMRGGRIDVSAVGRSGSFDMSLDFDGGMGTIVVVGESGTLTCSVDIELGHVECTKS